MTRSHTLIDLRKAERQLAEAVKEIKKIQSTQDYELDLQFFKELTQLMATYNYEPRQVAAMLVARDPNIDNPAYRNTTMLYVNRLSAQIDMEPNFESAEQQNDDRVFQSHEEQPKILKVTSGVM
ncbi:hypothetical protein I4N56_002740 [Pseudomonas mohnii]|uniref:hypothetical protein n=1 Tax=Pseudomonas mohnii TaxID=395600 RepID=UPI0018DB3A1B|nr:hypothetical protein [Pseudomonas mohnii]MBH8609980.1 hypothetical protein [Pseudomonas mohnii]